VTSNLFEHLQAALGAAYRLERELGGGMSRVFLATETALNRNVVIKVLLPELAASVSVDRFRREIMVGARLQHPLIVPLLSAGEIDGLPYFTMPFISGESLRVKLARSGELPVGEAVRILHDIVTALGYAHQHGVVHRDVKPDNVLLSGGVAVMTDFGVARALSDSTHASLPGLTSRGMALGTPNYMAPEQASGDPQIDHRADIYAVGVVAYEMLAGHTPFAGRTTQAVLAAHVVEAPEPIERLRPTLPPSLAALVMRCLAKRAADRPQSAAELLQVLEALRTPSGGIEPTRVTRVDQPDGKHSRVLLLGASVVVVALAAVVVLRPGPPAHSPAPAGAAAPPTPAPLERFHPDTNGGEPAAAAHEDTVRPVARPRPADAPARPQRVPAPPARIRAPARDSVPAPAPAPAPAAAAVPARAPEPAVTTSIPVSPPAPPVSSAVPDTTPAVALRPPAPAAPAPPAPGPAAAPPVARRPVPTPPSPPANPRPEIEAVLSAFAAAVESREVENIRRVYRGLTPTQERGWEQFFETVSDVDAELSIDQLDVANGSADAQVRGSYGYRNNSTGRTEVQPVSFRATFQREPGGWRIIQVR
jgi:hypothetical protein